MYRVDTRVRRRCLNPARARARHFALHRHFRQPRVLRKIHAFTQSVNKYFFSKLSPNPPRSRSGNSRSTFHKVAKVVCCARQFVFCLSIEMRFDRQLSLFTPRGGKPPLLLLYVTSFTYTYIAIFILF